MTTKPVWDGDRFRNEMKRQAVASQRYADEHRDRVRRGQANGKLHTAEEYEGDATACDTLSTSAASDDPHRLLERLDELEAWDTGEPPAYEQGYRGRIRRTREEVRRYI